MKVIFMLGTKSQKNADKLKQQIDSVEVYPYGTVKQMTEDVANRNLKFDRIVISTASMHDVTTMQILHRFLREYHPRATVVYIFKKGDGDALAREFNNVFNSPLYTDVAVNSNNVALLEEISIGVIDTIREKYSIRRYGQVDEDYIQDSYNDGIENDKPKIETETIKRPMLILPQSRKQRKRTGLFGVKKPNKRELAILNENLKLISDYMKYVLQNPNSVSKPVKQIIPSSARKSMSNPVEEYQMKVAEESNQNSKSGDVNKNQGNFTPNTTFTQLELGYYGFATSFDGRPMMFKTGISVTQAFKQ